MSICRFVNHTAVLSCIVEKGKLESAVTWLYPQTLREVSSLNAWNDVASLSLIIWCLMIGDVQTKLRFDDGNVSDLMLSALLS